jgi:inorganic pyrophosphatase
MLSPSGKDKKPRIKHGPSHAYLTQHSPQKLQLYAIALIIATGCICPFLPIEWSILTLVYSACCFGAIASLWLSRSVLNCDEGTPEMRAVSDPIREGAEGFLHVQYTAIAKFAVPLAGLIVLSYQFRPSSDEAVGVTVLGNQILGLVAAGGFVAGAACSALSGYTAMWVAARSNIRVASAARRTYGEALVVCFRGGAFSAVLNLTLCILGKHPSCTHAASFILLCNGMHFFADTVPCLMHYPIGVTSLYTILHFLFARAGGVLSPKEIPMLLVGYGFGASFVALFMQLGGGIYTKVRNSRVNSKLIASFPRLLSVSTMPLCIDHLFSMVLL